MFLCRTFYGPGDLFSHGLSHACHQKSAVADADHRRLSVNLGPPGHYSLPKSGLFLQRRHLYLISSELQRIAGYKLFIPLLKGIRIRDHLNPAAGMHPEVPLALRADVISFPHILRNDRRTAFIAFPEKSFRHLRTGLTERPPVPSVCFFKHILKLHRSFSSHSTSLSQQPLTHGSFFL